MKERKIKGFMLLFSLLIVGVIFIGVLTQSKKPDVKNPYLSSEQKGDEIETGEIVIEEKEEKYKGEADLDKSQIRDANKITYLRKEIPALNISLLMPEGWQVKESNSIIYFSPTNLRNKEFLESTRFSMKIEESGPTRKPTDVPQLFKNYKHKDYRYHINDIIFKPYSYATKDKKPFYDKNREVFIHKNRLHEYEQLPEIPVAADKNNYIKRKYYIGNVETGLYEMRDIMNGGSKAKIYTKNFTTITGNNKNITMNISGPTGYQMEIDEMARVVFQSIRPIEVTPKDVENYGNKPLTTPVYLQDIVFMSSNEFKNAKTGGHSYRADLYDGIYDLAYGTKLAVTYLPKNKTNLKDLDPRTSSYIPNLILTNYYSHMDEFYNYGYEIESNLYNKKEIFKAGMKGEEFIIDIDIPETAVVNRSELKISLPNKFIVTVLDAGNSFIVSSISFDNQSYEIAQKYNDSIINSIILRRGDNNE